jgi:tRNA pseudouridine38-40 synthase
MPEPETASGDLTRVRLDLAYDGTDFRGWSRQPGLRTVQGVLEDALATVFSRHPPAPLLTVAGRTDAGVHALGQVAHLDLTPDQLGSLSRPARGRTADRRQHGPQILARRLNGILGPASDVVLHRSSVAPPGFDARFSAVWRRYEYRIDDAQGVRDPLRRAFTLWHPAPLDEHRMDEAARSLTGLHDWAAYCKPREGATTIRTLQDFRWRREEDGVLVASLEADAFCHSMVRALVGACIAVGAGTLDPERLTGIRDERMRTSEFIVAAARGLTLLEVGYPDDVELEARAAQTRARREPIAFDRPGSVDYS